MLEQLKKNINYWISTPEPYRNDEDDVWSDAPLLRGDSVEVYNKAEWYESPNVVTIYKDHKYIFKNMGMGSPDETYYKENVDSGDFKSEMSSGGDLPSQWGDFTLDIVIDPQYPPSDDNEFALVEYWVKLTVSYGIPKGIDFLPRFVARPLNWMFRRIFEKQVAQQIVERDLEYAKEKMIQYFEYVRKYHGEEPVQMKTRQEFYEPVPEERKFFQ